MACSFTWVCRTMISVRRSVDPQARNVALRRDAPLRYGSADLVVSDSGPRIAHFYVGKEMPSHS